jgi:Fe-S-cluster containining protein
MRTRIIEKHLLKERGIVINPFTRGEYSFPRETASEYCFFFDEENMKCGIHLLKPETCVAGPITFDIDVNRGVIEWYLKTEKICRLAGILSRDDEMLKKHLASAKKEIMNLVKDLSRDELLAILRIDEPDTFKIEEDRLDSAVLKRLL